ncbi:hypothetical protein K474DRAFT_982805 [Panus rudis PR-1116 ss-1]|nr:hypothetical protein K474DRAFT_982805 [Panus rudis PR-1116 ss-1]
MQHHEEIEERDIGASPIADEADNSESVLSVPLEVLDHIASFLSDDEDAVKACSLATRQWRLAAKPLLFRSVSLKSARRLREFEAMLCSKSIRGAWIHNLSVTFPSRIKSQGDISAYFSLLPDIISMHLICLRELAFVDLCLPLRPPLPIANIVEAITNLSSIHTLSLTDCGMNEDVLHAMVCSSRNPLNLRLHDVWTRSTNPAELLPKHYPARLTSLRLTCSQDYKFTFGPWFVSSNCWRNLRSLQILIGVYDTLPILGEFIRCIGPALEHLELQLFPWRGIDRWRFIRAIQSNILVTI